MDNLYFSGIGSRRTPQSVLDKLPGITSYLYSKGFKLRSGACTGPDEYFERGVPVNEHKQIFLPWKLYNNHPSLLYQQHEEDFEIAKKFHPAWLKLSQGVRKLHARNVQIVAGLYETRQPSEFVVCYTPDGCTSHKTRSKDTGGTGMAISIADSLDIPVFNLANMIDYDMMISFVEDNY